MKKFTAAMLMALCAIIAYAARVDTIAIKTALVPGPDMNATVITPESYGADAKFPTVYLLNGYDGNHKQWTKTQPELAELAEKYGMIMVMPDGRDSWYWNSPAKPEMQMESFIIDELVPYIDANYPTKPCGTQRAITGLSMGGQGAMWLAINHPDVFGSVGSTSGGLDICQFPNNWKMAQWLGAFAENEDVWRQHSIISLVPKIEPGTLNIIFDCGNGDFFAGVNDALHQAMLAAGVDHDYISRPGKHSHAYWRNSILYQLLYFDQAFKRNNQ